MCGFTGLSTCLCLGILHGTKSLYGPNHGCNIYCCVPSLTHGLHNIGTYLFNGLIMLKDRTSPDSKLISLTNFMRSIYARDLLDEREKGL